MFDQLTADAAAAQAFGHVEILQVDVVADRPAAAVEDEMHQPHGLAVLPGQRRVHRFARVEEALPGDSAGFAGDLGLVEALVALPEGQPGGVVGGADRADVERCTGHAGSFRWWISR
ncbi:hypothetical protein D9M68_943340 [compost metagenome]